MSDVTVQSSGLRGENLAPGRKPKEGGNFRWEKRKLRGWYPPSVVEEVIRDFCDGNAAELERQMKKRTGKEISKQQVLGWRARGQFPPEFVETVHDWTRLPYIKLITRSRPRS